MKTVGLITEYNPFHNGHLYHLNKARELASADYCIVIMSGSFVQRGAPAIFDKYARTRMALASGADLVLEMPIMFSTSSAREFASFGVSLLDRLGIVDSLCFGSECGDISLLNSVAAILSKETIEYSSLLKAGMRDGFSFPKARANALCQCLNGEKNQVKTTLGPCSEEQLISLMEEPNNILGIEYCQAIRSLNSSITPITVTRKGSNYNSGQLDGSSGSALAIRNALAQKKTISQLSDFIPSCAMPYIRESTPVFLDDFSQILNYRIMELCNTQKNIQSQYLADYLDMNEDLASRLNKKALCFGSFDSRIKDLKSRQYTYTRVSRALLHLLLGIKTEDFLFYKDCGYASYCRILGFRKQAALLLSHLKSNTSIPILTKVADAEKLLDTPSVHLLEQEIYASHIYQMVRAEKGAPFDSEYSTPIAIL